MGAFWSRIEKLEGQILYTVKQQKPFNVLKVTNDRIVFVPQSGNGTPRWWPREDLERLDADITNDDEITPQRVREEWPNDQNTSYVPAILLAARSIKD